jgi:hypothetical protein
MMLMALAFAQAAVASPQPAEAATYMRCVAEQTKRLTPYGESAEAIAVAATFNCGNLLEAAGRAMDRAIPAPDRANHSFDQAMKLQATAREMSITAVVENRLRERSR